MIAGHRRSCVRTRATAVEHVGQQHATSSVGQAPGARTVRAAHTVTEDIFHQEVVGVGEERHRQAEGLHRLRVGARCTLVGVGATVGHHRHTVAGVQGPGGLRTPTVGHDHHVHFLTTHVEGGAVDGVVARDLVGHTVRQRGAHVQGVRANGLRGHRQVHHFGLLVGQVARPVEHHRRAGVHCIGDHHRGKRLGTEVGEFHHRTHLRGADVPVRADHLADAGVVLSGILQQDSERTGGTDASIVPHVQHVVRIGRKRGQHTGATTNDAAIQLGTVTTQRADAHVTSCVQGVTDAIGAGVGAILITGQQGQLHVLVRTGVERVPHTLKGTERITSGVRISGRAGVVTHGDDAGTVRQVGGQGVGIRADVVGRFGRTCRSTTHEQLVVAFASTVTMHHNEVGDIGSGLEVQARSERAATRSIVVVGHAAKRAATGALEDREARVERRGQTILHAGAQGHQLVGRSGEGIPHRTTGASRTLHGAGGRGQRIGQSRRGTGNDAGSTVDGGGIGTAAAGRRSRGADGQAVIAAHIETGCPEHRHVVLARAQDIGRGLLTVPAIHEVRRIRADQAGCVTGIHQERGRTARAVVGVPAELQRYFGAIVDLEGFPRNTRNNSKVEQGGDGSIHRGPIDIAAEAGGSSDGDQRGNLIGTVIIGRRRARA